MNSADGSMPTRFEPTASRHLPGRNYLNNGYTVRSWLLTTDHKRIAILYLLSVTFFFVIGGVAATIVRLDLMTPQGDLVRTETYNKLFTAHGVTMVFFFLIPSIPDVLGNFLVPLMIGARDLAFPKLNLLSWYVYIARADCSRSTRCWPAASTRAGPSTLPTAARTATPM